MLRLQTGHAISAVPTGMVAEAWPLVAEFLQDALDHAWGFGLDDIRLKLIKGDATLWVIEKDMVLVAAVVTEICYYPKCRALNIWLTGGEGFNQWKDCIASLEGYSRMNGCEVIEATGRPGLQRILKSLGFNVPRVVCAKFVDKVTH